MASSADPHAAVAAAMAGTTPSDSLLGAKKAGAAAAVWKLPEAATVPVAVVVENPIMDADSWPALPGLSSPPPPAAGPVAKASPKAASPASTGAVMSPPSLANPGAPDANPGSEAPVRNPVVQRALVMPAANGLEKIAPAPEPSPVYVPNARSNGADPHQNGRFGSHPHGRGGGYVGGNRRGNGGGGGRRGSEHHGFFDGQRRGGGRRDGHGPVHHQRGHQPTYIRTPTLAVVAGAPPPPPPFVSPATPQAPPYGTPMGFPDMAPQVYYYAAPTSEGIQGLPFMSHPASPQAVLIDPFRKGLLDQIEYYFSDANLCKDLYLRQRMDDQGWVPLPLIAGFPQVQKITNNIQFILETVMLSNVVEVQGDKLRRRGAWENWLLPKQNYSAGSSSGSLPPVTSNIDSLTSQFRFVGLEGATYHATMPVMHGEALLTRSATSVSLGYHASTMGGLPSNGSEPLLGPKSARNLLRSDTF
ncbi:la-related protein 1B isoform X2 [Zea mays]|uniref:HTH La-type RNA-binding domain-containing protein n=1 Tax=Zea mays TaxID=4577 RepID=A0A804LDV7_MAIZE|nr:la-related protein 1B isoform X2 [Zea mays]|eukprot:XP_008651177.1 la-related protein 1B isoform X2 [Zea mays]